MKIDFKEMYHNILLPLTVIIELWVVLWIIFLIFEV